MSEETTGDNLEKVTPAAAPTAETTETTTSADGSGAETPSDDSKTDELTIPKHRFDEESQKRKEMEKQLASEKARSDAMEQRMNAMGEALQGKTSDNTSGSEAAKLAKKYGVEQSFIDDILDTATRKAEANFEQKLKPLQASTFENHFEREFNSLTQANPEASKDPEIRSELKKMVLSGNYGRTPMKDLYKIYDYENSKGRNATLEASEGGSRKAKEQGSDITSDMSLAEFEKATNEMAAKQK